MKDLFETLHEMDREKQKQTVHCPVCNEPIAVSRNAKQCLCAKCGTWFNVGKYHE